MSKTNFFVKHLKNINNFINNLLEKNLNKLNSKNLSFLIKNNKIILTFVALLVVFISYLLLPTFYNQNDISKQLKNKLQNKFDLNFKFSKNIKYNFFPKPHFIITESKILNNEKEISKISKLKIFISFDDLFSLKNIEVRDLILENANFNLNTKNYNFFLELLNRSFQDGDLIINNSNVFFKHLEDEVLFISKIFKMKYYFDTKELKNIFYSENEIFNIPFSVESFFSEDKKKNLSTINFNLIKLNIENELIFENDAKVGKSKLNLNKIKRFVDYKIKKNSFDFHIFDKIDEPDVAYKGKFNFKPFFANLEGSLDEINLRYLFGNNAIVAQLLKTEIFNNKNIDFELNINANSIYKNSNFKNIHLNSKIQEGLIDTDNTKFEWKDIAEFELLESLIFVRNGELVLDGKLKINVKDYKEIYKFLLTPKNYRNKIGQIDLNFSYNFDQKIAELKDIKIDNKINQNINKILSNIIIKKDDLQNKIYFKNLLNEAIKSYAG
ncbi:AsmA family protein [Candidatus Pelagibacter sp.]|uniref:AsmA family protein n=1 Tax=Candidatus Pelagibacter sp. TaxID=2024849 RepID=UPI003F85BF4D